ncbi:MAG TPA: DNA primase DnaG [archaeon]|nr:DNA primase DnaG [archaeon]
MAKLAQNFAKYLIYAKMHAKGVIERPDVIGAIFGQTEGLLGSDLDLRDLQHTGRIGRIEVNIKTSKGMSYAEITLPSSLDNSETALIAASMETIDKVGPCEATVEISKVEDVRTQKRKFIIERAKNILKAMIDEGTPDSHKLAETIKEDVRTLQVANFNGLSCGPEIETADEIIIVEGRADVINLLRNGIKNSIAMEGSKIPDALVKLTKEKTVIAFLDGDRGGDLDMKKLLAIADIDFITRAEEGYEVEDLTKKQIFKALRERIPLSQYMEFVKNGKYREQPEQEITKEELSASAKKNFYSLLEESVGTRAAYIIDKNLQVIAKVPLSEIIEVIDNQKDVYAIVFDGKINESIVELAESKGIKYVVGMSFKDKIRSRFVTALTIEDLKE